MSLRETIKLTVAMAVAAAVAACSAPGNDYAAYADIPSGGWVYDKPLTFYPVHPDSLVSGHLVVGVRHDNTYPYRSLWLEVTTIDCGQPRRDTMDITLADRYGSWTGIGIGTSFQATDTIGRSILHASHTPVTVRHIMRADTLRGISQLGIFFLPAGG